MNKTYIFSLITAIAVGSGAWFFYSSTEIASDEHEHEHHHHGHNHEDEEHDHDHDDSMLVLSDKQIALLDIETLKAGPGKLNLSFATRGKIILHPDHLAHILPKISGVALIAKKNIGDQVTQGELIAVLESHEIAEMKANYLAMLEREKLTFSLYERESLLYGKGITAQEEYLDAKSKYEEAKINTRLAKQKLQAFGLVNQDIVNLETQEDQDLRLFQIYSPMDGTILARHITKGEYIEETSTIYEIADLRSVWVEIGIYPRDISKVSRGQLIEIVEQGVKQKTHAEIIYLSPVIREETITAKAIAELPNPDNKWKPGTFVKVNVATEQQPVAILVPCEAIQCMGEEDFIFIRNDAGFEKRVIQKGRTDNENIEIISGLMADEIYASSQTFILKAEQNKFSAEHEH